jgi:DMSO/TMAO reductase YedYZ molybdopterin-dependent catalytic subunit
MTSGEPATGGPAAPPASERWTLGAAVGLAPAAVALGVAELVAAFIRPESAPLSAVAAGVIRLSPAALVEFGAQNFGSNDKTALQTGTVILLAFAAVVIGRLAVRRPGAGLAGIALFGLVGIVAAMAQHDAGALDLLPSLLGAVAGAVTLHALLRVAGLTTPAGTPVTDPGRPSRLAAEGADGLAGLGLDAERADTPRPAPSRVEPRWPGGLERRRVLGWAAGTGIAAVVVGAGGWALQRVRFAAERSRSAVRLPAAASKAAPDAGAQLDVTGLPPWITPAGDFYRVDTALTVPQVAADTWKLRIHGMVDHPVTITYEQLLKRSLIERDITLTCVSNEVGGPYIGNARWLGARLADLLREAGLHPNASQLVSRSSDGMTIGTPASVVMDGRDAMLAVGMNGEPLPVEHGFPVRMVVPGLYGYVSACKWIVDIEATTFARYDAYWVDRGWAQQAPIKTESRIDTPRDGATKSPGTVQVAGVAWAQHRGIRKVEVQVDGGDWHQARLAAAPTTDTWRQWVWSWPAGKGHHTLKVRATDTAGTTQTSDEAPPLPDGATGYHTVSVTIH